MLMKWAELQYGIRDTEVSGACKTITLRLHTHANIYILIGNHTS